MRTWILAMRPSAFGGGAMPLLLAAVLAGCAGHRAAAPPASGAEPAATPTGEGAASAAEPDDRAWQADEEGQRFYVEKLPKFEGWGGYIDRDEKLVKYYGIKVQFEREDEEWFYLHVYDTPPAPEPVSDEPTLEEIEAVEATYRFATPAADRLRFESFDRGLPKRNMWRNGFAIADMNRDGHLDIVHSPPRRGDGLPVIFLGDGEGNWRSWRARFPRRYDYGDVAVADFNGDGHQDLALAIHLRGVRVLVGDGRGGFTEWSEGTDYAVPGEGVAQAEFSSRALEAVDFDGDGRIDVLAVSEGPIPAATARDRLPPEELEGMIFVMPGPVVYFNQGDGTWVKHSQDTSAHEVFGDTFTVADFDGDGRPDFATATYMMTRKDILHYNRDGAGWKAERLPEIRPLAYVHAVTATDFDGDGRTDLALTYLSFELATYRNGVDILYNRPDGTWERRTLFSRQGRELLVDIAHGDLDGDGSLDLVAVDTNGNLPVWLGDGEGFFVREEAPELGPPSERCRGYDIDLADLDGDGRAEVVTNFADSADAMWDPLRCPSQGGLAAWTPVPARVEGGQRSGAAAPERSWP